VSAPDLSALVSARLCHDPISPMGAIRNGMELLQMAPGTVASPEHALISDSLETALAKLRYFRLAFGPAEAQARQAFGEAVQVTDAMFSGRFTVTWETRGIDMPRQRARMIYLAILCLEKSLPMGGSLRVAVDGDVVDFNVEGRRTAPPETLWRHVTEGMPLEELRPDAVQFALLREALTATGHRIEASFTDTAARLRLTEISQTTA
jgi:histidine phosphotransferase ChpT